MKLLKISLISFLVIFSFVLSPAVFAEEQTEENRSIFSASDIDFSDFEIVSQAGNNFELSFTINNGQRAQSGVRYGVVLNSKGTSPIIEALDEYVYEELLTIESNYSLTKKINYKAPSGLSGDYEIRIFIKNKNGLMLSLSGYKEIALEKSGDSLELTRESCSVVIKGAGEPKQMTLGNETIFVSEEENVSIECLVKNKNQGEVTLTPLYEIYSNSLYGDLIEKELEPTVISLLGEEEKNIIWDLPKPSLSGTYVTKIFLENENIRSNNILFSYRSSNENKVNLLNNISLDKTGYSKGEEATISLIWINPNFNNQEFILKTSILDKKGKVCLPETTKNQITTGQITLTGEMVKDCINPRVIAKIENTEGEVIASEDLVFETINKIKTSILDIVILVLIVILVVAGIIIFFVKPKNKKEELKNNEEVNYEKSDESK